MREMTHEDLGLPKLRVMLKSPSGDILGQSVLLCPVSSNRPYHIRTHKSGLLSCIQFVEAASGEVLLNDFSHRAAPAMQGVTWVLSPEVRGVHLFKVLNRMAWRAANQRRP